MLKTHRFQDQNFPQTLDVYRENEFFAAFNHTKRAAYLLVSLLDLQLENSKSDLAETLWVTHLSLRQHNKLICDTEKKCSLSKAGKMHVLYLSITFQLGKRFVGTNFKHLKYFFRKGQVRRKGNTDLEPSGKTSTPQPLNRPFSNWPV